MTSTGTYLTPPQLAQIYGVKPAKILAWISSGELGALNLAARGTSRPRYRISPEAIAQFECRRSAGPLPKQVRRRRPASIKDFV
jgi:hypothetical protein